MLEKTVEEHRETWEKSSENNRKISQRMGPKWLPKRAHNGPQNGAKMDPEGVPNGVPRGSGNGVGNLIRFPPLPDPVGGLLRPDWGGLGGGLEGSGGPVRALGGVFFEAHFQGLFRKGFGSDLGPIWGPESGPR